MIKYSPIGMYCGVPKLESSQTDDVAHHAIALVCHTRCSIKCFATVERFGMLNRCRDSGLFNPLM